MADSTLHPAYALHTRRYGDSSLIVELFVRDQGRVACVARGALRAKRPVVYSQPFQRLAVEIRGRGEVGTLSRAEAGAAPLHLAGRRLYCGLYLNELLMRLTARNDSHPALFDAYAAALVRLAGNDPVEPLLRQFEVRLLREIGLGMVLDVDTRGQPIEPHCRYTYAVTNGAVPAGVHDSSSVSGETLLGLHSGCLVASESLREARQLMRAVLDHHLDGRPLRSRELFQAKSRDSK